MLGGPRERSGFPPPSGRVTPPLCGLVLLRRSQPFDWHRLLIAEPKVRFRDDLDLPQCYLCSGASRGDSAQRAGKSIDGIEETAQRALQVYDRPGNVRELENTIERAVMLSTEPMITTRSLSVPTVASPSWNGLPGSNLHQNQEWVEPETISRALEASGGCEEGGRRPDRHQSARAKSLSFETPNRLTQLVAARLSRHFRFP